VVSLELRRRRWLAMTDRELRGRVADRSARVAVIGCGYVGLPLAIAFADVGFTVTAVDVDASKIASLREGRSYIDDVNSGALKKHVDVGRLLPTTDYEELRHVDVVFVSVPTPFDRAKQPDLSFVTAAAEGIAPRLRRGQLVILESTTYPGTTEDVLRPILERSGFVAGKDFYLAFSPERIDPGNKRFRIENTPKVVGGVDPVSTALAVMVLEQVIPGGQVRAVSSARAAELTKLLENTFRAVNIALVNELAMLCDRMRIDVWEVIDAAATKPYGFMPFYPGPGVGGHCIPVDPYYLSWKAREYDFHTKFIELAAETNLAMPFFTAERIHRLLDGSGKALAGAKILAIGAAFKPNIGDARGSAAIRVMEILHTRGAEIRYHDPHVAKVRLGHSLFDGGSSSTTIECVPLDDAQLGWADCVVLLVAHSAVDIEHVLAKSVLLFDAVNATRGHARVGVERL
jgi:UDP-N-acetyl-D-glucosamine dehydrogenase